MIRNLEWELYATVVEANDKESVIDRLTQDNERLQEECDKNVDMTREIQRLNEVNEMLSARLMEGYNKAMADKGLLMARCNDLGTLGLEGNEASGRYGTQAQEPSSSASSATPHTTRVAKKRKTFSPGSRVPRMQVSSKVRANYTDSDE
ncbi:uncharacterized protein J4E84_006791 [Alternaria hordeiaustralica]|uniref:uncharacterized protein n=1 Tax=Alternaria hordeiaustralica TaxID=1187925 RepID=UPI0020C56959|nr:uncharacterized protein J4E84_006791 [Alternaria hordeiaustralica]KAI4683951.1 hypothetical protein J4E84_006791 [Alternaria hordeiaustralica]